MFLLNKRLAVLALASALPAAADRAAADPGEAMTTRWARDVSADAVRPEYPRPQLVRERWQNLNGRWDLAITGLQKKPPKAYTEKILVPFPLESHLGGAMRGLSPSHRAWYRRTFKYDAGEPGERLLLHFGAVDWHAEVWVNGIRAGDHRGGFDPFTFDVTALVKPDADNEIVVGVADPTDAGEQPRGKQKRFPEGIWYTPVSGIWQTVWLEPVPASYVRGLTITPDCDRLTVAIAADVAGDDPAVEVEVAALRDGAVIAKGRAAAGEAVTLAIDDPQLWSPEQPFLYDLRVRLVRGDRMLDEVDSYFGMRSVGLGPDQNGQQRILLNGEPLFQFGPLDQGYWPDGLYTAPTDEALRYDLEMIKRMGFNMVRKHAKVEPARWYWWCDRLGLLVWQDMPSGGELAPWPADGQQIERSAESAAQYRRELQGMVDALQSFPSVVAWAPFNEGWGQFDTEGVTEWLETYDPTRLVVAASGGNDFGVGHAKDDHFYPGPGAPPAERHRAAVLGEFGGLGLLVRDHAWQGERSWGYRRYETHEDLAAAYAELLQKLRPLVESHLSAAVYTQLTDVELEVNGLMTYDRAQVKGDVDTFRTLAARLYEPLPQRSDPQRVAASVLAWWRFEEGEPGAVVSDLTRRMGAVAAQDRSGRNNHLYAFSPQNAPAVSDDAPRRSLGAFAEENRLCLDDSASGAAAATRDLFTDPHTSRTHMDMVDSYQFTEWTVEASFRLAREAGEQAVVAKEVSRDGVIEPLFQLGVFGEQPTIGLEVADGSAKLIKIDSGVAPSAGKWLHVCATCDGSVIRLYVAGDDPAGGYQLVGEAAVEGAMSAAAGPWTVGRGCEGGRMGRDFLGWIDEVRISTKALQQSQFLYGGP